MGVVIAIDGPAGSGKSTVATAMAQRLGCEELDTGAMYRAVTLIALRTKVDLEDGAVLGVVAEKMGYAAEGTCIFVDGEDVSKAIRQPEVDQSVSQVSAHQQVRTELVRRQRQWVAERGGGVVEGRDIGSVVLPDADVRVYLTADPVERERRRADPTLARRDALDSGRKTSPLVVPAGSIVIDSTDLSVEQVVEEVLSHL